MKDNDRLLLKWMLMPAHDKVLISGTLAASATEIIRFDTVEEAAEFLLRNAKIAAVEAGMTEAEFDEELAKWSRDGGDVDAA